MKDMAWVMARCESDGDCLLWTLAVTEAGHPRYSHRDGTPTQMRRVVWAQTRGAIPPGKVVTVNCGCPKCLNWKHLALTTKAEVLRKTMKRPDVMLRKSTAVTRVRRARGKLDMDKARYIRASDKTLQAVAEELGVSVTLACRVRRGEAWRELAASPFAGLGGRA